MPRLNVVDPQTATGTVKEIFEGPLAGKHFNIFKGLANSPTGLKAYLGLNEALGAGSLSDKEKEAVALVVGELNGCDYCVAAHTAIGKQAGLAEDQTIAIRKGDATGDAKLDALATFARALNEKRGWVTDEDLEAFRAAGYDDAAVVEVITAYALNVFTNTFNHVNGSVVDFPAAPAVV